MKLKLPLRGFYPLKMVEAVGKYANLGREKKGDEQDQGLDR